MAKLPQPVSPESTAARDHCEQSPTSMHQPDFASLSPCCINDTDHCIVDISCKHCGRSGAFCVDSTTEIDW